MSNNVAFVAVLKTRVKGRVRFVHFTDGALYYMTDDGWTFPVPVSDTSNPQGGSAIFLAEDKAILFMKWIRQNMEAEDDRAGLTEGGEA